MGGLELGGKRVIVTGAAGGLGRAFAEAFAGAGASRVDIGGDGRPGAFARRRCH